MHQIQNFAMTVSKMLSWRLPISIALFIVFSLCQTSTFALKKSYVVYMGSHSHGPKITKDDLHKVTVSQFEFLGSFLGSKERAKDAIFYSYRRNINGFAAVLDEDRVAEISKHPKVVSVFPNLQRKLHTTHSWNFLSLENANGVVHSSSLWKKARYGEDIIIANLDTGVWPESESFSDKGYGPIPSKWKGICDTKDGILCNRKLIGTRYFSKGFETYLALTNITFNSTQISTRDYEGHGTHTLSTAGGNSVPGANIFGVGNGTATGGSPRARLAAYKTCWPTDSGGCFDADILKAFDIAIDDGVDVISASIGGSPSDYFEDSISIGSFHAAKHGIVVVSSAGNAGPTPGTVSNVAPWMLTIGASTIDREFVANVVLGSGLHLKGTSISKPLPQNTFYPIVIGAHAKAHNASAETALLCEKGTLDPHKVKGKILVCLRGETSRLEKGEQAFLSGAVGLILCNDEASGGELLSDPHVLTASHINYTAGLSVFAYINSTKDPKATITPPTVALGTKPAPFMAAFSSTGPNTITPEILKPDITAPGVNIIAAYSGATSPSETDFDKRRTPFITMSGTSMSCPHVSGVVGLLKALHPDWSPAAIKSAIMTTARRRDNTHKSILDGSLVEATPFSYGAGHVEPNLAADPGLVYDLKVEDYNNFLCALGYNETIIALFSRSHYKCPTTAGPLSLLNFNYPSITVPRLSGSVTVTRTLKNVGSPGNYKARVYQPRGISVHVEPRVLKFKRIGQQKSFNLTLKAISGHTVPEKYVFGHLIWLDGVHSVRSPIVVATAAKRN